MRKICLGILVLISISCSKEIEIDIPHQKPSLIVYSTIIPFTLPRPKFLSIDIKATKHIFDTLAYPITDVNILLYKNDNKLDTLKYINSLKTYPLNFFPKVGETYSIVIEKEGYETITAQTTIPSKVKITDTVVTQAVYFDDTGSVFSEVAVTFTDPVNETNFYELVISDIAFSYDTPDDFFELSTNDKIITSESYYPSLERFYLDKPQYLLFNDKMINGKEHTLIVYYTPPQEERVKRYIVSHYITIHLRNVTEDYYKFKTTMLQHLNSKQEDILFGMGEPINAATNIQNGFGLFAGFNNDIVSLRLDSLIVSK